MTTQSETVYNAILAPLLRDEGLDATAEASLTGRGGRREVANPNCALAGSLIADAPGNR